MNINREEIIHMANLARLDLTENEIARYAKDMESILNFANIINNISTENIDESFAGAMQVNVFRKDEVKVFEDTEALMKNAVSIEDGMFHLPSVI